MSASRHDESGGQGEGGGEARGRHTTLTYADRSPFHRPFAAPEADLTAMVDLA